MEGKILANIDYVIGSTVASFDKDIDDGETIRTIIEQCDAYGKLFERDVNSPFLKAYHDRLKKLGLKDLRVDLDYLSNIVLDENTKYVFTNGSASFSVAFSNKNITQGKLKEILTAVVALYESDLGNLIIYLTSLGCIYFEYGGKVIINMTKGE